MKRWRQWVVCGMVLLGLAGRAMACLNDTEVRRTEEEFRSRYERPVDKGASWRTVWGVDLLGAAGLVVGVGVIGFVSVRAMTRRR